MDEMQLRYLKVLAKSYPTIATASTEIINTLCKQVLN